MDEAGDEDVDDATRWDERYRGSGRSVACPPDVLADHPDVARLVPTSGHALDVACGTGAQSLWLAARGLRVTALDVSPVAIDLTRFSARRAGLEAQIDARVVDLDAGIPLDAGPDGLDVVVCQRFRDPALYATMVDRLRPSGLAIVTVLSAAGLAAPPGPFHAPLGELRRAFSRDDTELLVDVEADGSASVVVRRR